MSFEGLSEKNKSLDRKNNESAKMEWKFNAEVFFVKFRENNVNRWNELARKSSGWNLVYTIEGNSSNSVAPRKYDLKSTRIDGYGVNGGTDFGKTPVNSTSGIGASTL